MATAFQPNYQRHYYQAHRVEKLAYARANQERANARRRERSAGKPKRRIFPYAKTRFEALQQVSGLDVPECCVCKISDVRVLTINHKAGNGNDERATLAGKEFYKAIVIGVRQTIDLDVRCHNCNVLYEYERGRL